MNLATQLYQACVVGGWVALAIWIYRDLGRKRGA